MSICKAKKLLILTGCCYAGSFAGLGFIAWYMAGKIRAFDRRGHVAKLCILFLPLLAAALVGVSRVDDYWHHWQDVFAGGFLGGYLCLYVCSSQKCLVSLTFIYG